MQAQVRLMGSTDGVALSVVDFGGSGPAILFLHGLAGHGGEWQTVVELLGDGCRTMALDLRGHGHELPSVG